VAKSKVVEEVFLLFISPNIPPPLSAAFLALLKASTSPPVVSFPVTGSILFDVQDKINKKDMIIKYILNFM